VLLPIKLAQWALLKLNKDQEQKIAGMTTIVSLMSNVMHHWLPKICHAQDLVAGDPQLMRKNKQNGKNSTKPNGRQIE